MKYLISISLIFLFTGCFEKPKPIEIIVNKPIKLPVPTPLKPVVYRFFIPEDGSDILLEPESLGKIINGLSDRNISYEECRSIIIENNKGVE